jgi:hypothetical protein
MRGCLFERQTPAIFLAKMGEYWATRDQDAGRIAMVVIEPSLIAQ